jgi:uncharacterized flavoprotein (TIGR03862 family)
MAPSRIAVVGGGPAGLMAAETIAKSGASVEIFDAMPSVGRKFLMAGKSGLNLTHAEDFSRFLDRFGASREQLAPLLRQFGPAELRQWAAGLGIETFVGSSGRVFPTNFKAAPLLRAWLRQLRESGVGFHMRHKFRGWNDNALVFETPNGAVTIEAEAVVLALGGASWPRLGSDAAWVPVLARRGVAIQPFLPANCGFDIGWSPHFRDRFAGVPVKSVALTVGDATNRGEFVITASGIEGSAVYAHAAALRDAIVATGAAELILDLAPDRTVQRLTAELSEPRGSRSMSDHLRRRCGIVGVKAGLLRECLTPDQFAEPHLLAAGIKALRLKLRGTRPIAEAISSAGGISFDAVDDALMLRALPGVFCAGEMLDWEVPTGGYLLTACFAMGRAAGLGVTAWLDQNSARQTATASNAAAV